MLAHLEHTPDWVIRLGWTLGTLAVVLIAGHLVNAIVVSRLLRWSSLTRGKWDVLVSRTVFALAAMSVTFAVASIASRLVADYGSRVRPETPVTTLSQNVAWLLVSTFGVLIVLNGLGVSITPMVTAFGIGGLAVALALQDPLANFFAGLLVTLARQFRIGDYIKLDSGIEGEIIDFNWRLTRIRTLQNKIVLVPNAKLAQAIVTNFSLPARGARTARSVRRDARVHEAPAHGVRA
jgi:small-conductance mechanosensitive channel